MTPRQKEVRDRILARRGQAGGPYPIWIHNPDLCERAEALSAYIPAWFAILGPARTPGNAVKVLGEATEKVLASQDVIDALANQGIEPGYASPAELDAFLKADAILWSKLVNELGIKPPQ